MVALDGLAVSVPETPCSESNTLFGAFRAVRAIQVRLERPPLVMCELRDTPRLFCPDHHAIALPEGHKFPVGKYGILRELLEHEGRFRLEPAPLADVETLELAHDPAYVQGFLQGDLPPSTMRRIGLPWSEALVKRAFASVGGTISAAADALETGWGGTLGGGTHHAFRAEGAGFCVFNDIAVAIESLRQRGRIRRAAVIDLDVHQGDGTAEVFRNDADVFTL